MKKILIGSVICAVSVVAAAGALDAIGDVRLKGHIGKRLDTMIEGHVIGTDIDYITAPFLEKTERNGWWQSEFWGKYMHSAMPYLKYTNSEKLRASVERGIDRILSSQEENGYIGNYPDELRCNNGWDVWGMKYTMMGLLHYYDWTRGRSPAEVAKGDKVLQACRRLCDYVIAELGPGGNRKCELWQTGNWAGMASSSICEPVMWLYNRTKDKKYLDFAGYIIKGMTEPASGPRLLDLALKGIPVAERNGHGNKPETSYGYYVHKHNRWKAYEMMSCYQGMIEYYEVTGRKELLEAAIKTADSIVRDEINLAGGCTCSEAWFHGASKQHKQYLRLQETCVTTTWMRFCEKLLEITGDSKWADQLERTFYNVYLGALRPSGEKFEAYTPLNGSRYHGMHHCYMHTDCCTANGPRGFLCFMKKFFYIKNGEAVLNFYSSALVNGKLDNGAKVGFDVYTVYPRSINAEGEAFIRIVSHTDANAGEMPLKLRIPACVASADIYINGKKQATAKPGGYHTIKRTWKLGDVIAMSFKMPVICHRLGDYVAFTSGPILLARDTRFNDGDLSEPFRIGIKGGQAMPMFYSVRTPGDDIWMTFSATLPLGQHDENPEGRLYSTVFFCDFSSAGNTWRRNDFYRTWFPVELNPMDSSH